MKVMRRNVVALAVPLTMVGAAATGAQTRAVDEPAQNRSRTTATRLVIPSPPSRAIDFADQHLARTAGARGVTIEPTMAAQRAVGAAAQSRKSRTAATKWSIVVGVAAGGAIAAGAAARYGDNEGGNFCGRCFVRWSAFTVPAGAGIGAAIGFLIDRARR